MAQEPNSRRHFFSLCVSLVTTACTSKSQPFFMSALTLMETRRPPLSCWWSSLFWWLALLKASRSSWEPGHTNAAEPEVHMSQSQWARKKPEKSQFVFSFLRFSVGFCGNSSQNQHFVMSQRPMVIADSPARIASTSQARCWFCRPLPHTWKVRHSISFRNNKQTRNKKQMFLQEAANRGLGIHIVLH